MILKNVASQGVYLYAVDTTTPPYGPKTGDAANITGSYTIDGTDHSGFTTAHPTEIGGGVYWQPLSQGETNGNEIAYRWTSSTSGCFITPVFRDTSGVNLPAVAYSGSGGLPILGTGAGGIHVDGSGNVYAVDSAGSALATASAVANIAVTSAALNQTAASILITTGTETGTVSNTTTSDGVYDSVADVAGTVDYYYQFSLGSTGQTGVGVSWLGYVVGVVNTIKVYAYNWGGSSWDQIGTIVGIAGIVNQSQDWELTSAHTGTGGNLGLVRIRFNATGLTTSSTKTDRILCGYAVVTTYPANFSSLSISGGGKVAATVASGDDIDAASIKTTIGIAGAGLTAVTGVTLAASQHVIVDSGTVNTLTNLPGAPTDWLTAAAVKADAVTKIQVGLATPTNITAGIITTVTNLTNAPTAGDFTTTMKSSITAAATAATPTVTAGTVSDKTGYSLGATGLDSITASDPGGVASTWPQMLVAVWRLFFKKSAKAVSGLTIKTYADDGTTVRTTQTYTDDGVGNEVRNAATGKFSVYRERSSLHLAGEVQPLLSPLTTPMF
jgi:hypothetical protein